MKMKRCITASILLMLSLEASLLIAGQPSSPPTAWAPFSCRAKAKVVMEAPRPWKCCDVASCTKSMPPTCSCMDVVDNCAPTCKVCRPVYQPRRVCLDQYTGDTGPKCTEEDVAAGGN